MKAVDLCIFLSGYTLVVAFASLYELFLRRRYAMLTCAVLALASVALTVVVGSHLEPGRPYLETFRFLVQQRDASAVVAATMGVAAGLVWLVRFRQYHGTGSEVTMSWFRRLTAHGVLVASIVGVVACSHAFIWKELNNFQRDPPVRVHAPGFVIEKVADLDFLPVRVAADESGRVYVCYDYFEKWGTMGGAIVELTRDTSSGRYHQKIVADSTLLMRSYGLVARNGELWVSRSGVYSRASQGRVSYENTGAITRLRDVDHDGYFEFADDVVTDLPGARGPDTMQQNNGICFGKDGSLFVTVSSAANRTLDAHPWAGSVLHVSPDFSRTEVFAKGFRNPFGIVVGPDDAIFVTDNDIDENPGDELDHVIRGAHYGHPYVVPNEADVEATGFRDPILLGELESNFLGLAYAVSPALPEEYRDCLYMADFMQNEIKRIKLVRSGDTYKVASVARFATISSPVDIAVTPGGEFFIVSRRTQNVYCIRPTDTATERQQ